MGDEAGSPGLLPTSGWKPDPFGRHELRWFNGTEWTGHVSDRGVPSYEGATQSAASTPRAAAKTRIEGINAAILACAAVLGIGSFLPWAKVSAGFLSRSVSGVEGDGVITLGLAAGIAALLLTSVLKRNSRGALVGILVCGIVALAVTIYDLANVARIADESSAYVDVGIGLYMCIMGAAAATIVSVVALRQARRRSMRGEEARDPA